jgi:prophage maintenance system killer protein
MAAYTFLAANGPRLQAPEEEAVLQTLALAAGESTAADYAAWLGRSCG